MVEHLEHGYGLREIVTHLVCSVTTVPPTCPRQWRKGTELVGTLERDRRPDRALYERIGETMREAVYCLPAGAVRRHQ